MTYHIDIILQRIQMKKEKKEGFTRIGGST